MQHQRAPKRQFHETAPRRNPVDDAAQPPLANLGYGTIGNENPPAALPLVTRHSMIDTTLERFQADVIDASMTSAWKRSSVVSIMECRVTSGSAAGGFSFPMVP